MPKNAGKGGNKRKKGKKQTMDAREWVYKSEMEEYGQVIRLLGDARWEIQCLDGIKRIGHIRGKIQKRKWIANGNIVLVSLREYENDKCDVIDKYSEDEVRKLKKAGEIPESIETPGDNEEEEENKNDNYNDIVFEDEEKEEGKEDGKDKKKSKKWEKSDSESSEEEDAKDIDVDDI